MKWPESSPNPRPATWGQRSAPSSTARSDSSRSSRQRFGASSTCTSAKVTGRPIAAERRRIQPDLLHRGDRVLAGDAGGRELEHTGTELAERSADAEELVFGRVGPRHRLAVDREVGDGARGGETERARGDGLLHQCLHALDVGGGRRVVAGAALTHHVRADRAVRDLGADVDRPVAALQSCRGTRGRSPTPTRSPRRARCPECPRHPP